MRLYRNMYLTAALLAATADFFYLAMLRSLNGSGVPGGDIPHTLLVLITTVATFLAIWRTLREDEELKPMQAVWRVMMTATFCLLLVGLLQVTGLLNFGVREGVVSATSYASLVTSTLLAMVMLAASAFIFLGISRLLFVKRRRTTKRNFIVMCVLSSLFVLFGWLASPNGAGMTSLDTVASIAYALAIAAVVVNAFRFSWILLLSRREKFLHLIVTLFGFLFFLILTIYSGDNDNLALSLELYHPLVENFVSLTFLFGTVYTGVGFTSTLLHLPTAKEFDRKKTEISSLQNLSRLTTQVFDFDELVATTSQLALEVSESDSAWLELADVHGTTPGKGRSNQSTTRIVDNSLRNITSAQVESLHLSDGSRLQHLAIETEKPVLIQDLESDRRVHASTRGTAHLGTLAMLPLISRGDIIGLLCVGKRTPYEYDRDVLNVLYAFADIASVAIENSRLIRESFVKERMEQELLVAKQMQQSLLPQTLPALPSFEIAARSVPAYEVGGDYYDVRQLDEGKIGITVGDVSGKGVSAALYMAQLKGASQSIGQNDLGPRDFLLRLNTALWRSMERKSFISLLYCIVDHTRGSATFARAGHCPLLFLRGQECRYLQPGGMALGLEGSERFADVLEESELHLQPGDVLMMFTDGVTEAHDADGTEFEYERLADVLRTHGERDAQSILDAVFNVVRNHRGTAHAEDDMTGVVLRWRGV
ncbi:MAG: PP2C family protein-serine/threonine phosphatase [Bacteroidia bacterium]|nr:PP2C family protein-serine/threonine phosphatase [Bacteroidia bacterium]